MNSIYGYITKINPDELNEEQIIKMIEKLEIIIGRELLKMYSHTNALEYRFLSRFYSTFTNDIYLSFINKNN